MAIRLHGSARTTPRIRAEFQLATGSHRSLAQLYGINPKTVAKWRARTSVLDEPMGPRDRASQHLSQEQEHLAIALRKQGHLSLDIRSRLQLRQALEGAQVEDAISSDLRGMGERSRPL
ncbi:hypothetical protein [Delftia deserti]|uniref:Transposase n=1 Tax=Delftia deserti TaxID=1651218 RepID=A0ABW5ELX9_9BURK